MKRFEITTIVVEPKRTEATVLSVEQQDFESEQAARNFAGYTCEVQQKTRRKFEQGHALQRVAYLLREVTQPEQEAQPEHA